MPAADYQYDMATLLGLRDWENPEQPRAYWGLRRQQALADLGYAQPNAGLGADGASYGYLTGGGGGFGSYSGAGAPAAAAAAASPAFASFGAARMSGADVGGAGGAEPGSFSGADQGLNAVSPTFGDWLGHVATGLGLAMGPTSAIAAPVALGLSNYLGVNPSLSLAGVARSAFEGGGGIGEVMGNPASEPGADRFGAVGENENSDMMSAGAAADFGFGGSADPGGDHGPDGFAKGGAVTMGRLMGPNPPGPDDGYAALKAGEHVLTPDEVMAAGGHRGVETMRKGLRSGRLTLAELIRAAKD